MFKIFVLLTAISVSSAQVYKDLEGVSTSRDFTGKVALVTGSSSGIGAGIVKHLASLGAQVVVHGTNATKIESVAEEVQQLSPKKLKPLQVVADLSDDKAIERLVNETIKAYGRLDILVNNAGIGTYTTIDDKDFISTFDRIHRIDLRAPALLNHLSVPHLKETNGTIIQISGLLAIAPTSLTLPVNLAKTGLDMMTRCLALELGSHGVRVNSVNPGLIDTNINIPGFPPEELAKMRDGFIKATPMGRMGQPLDIARGVAFLASSDASFITGANLVVDGGILYHMGGLMEGLMP